MIRRLILIVLGVIVLVFVVGAVGLYWFLSGDGVRRALEQQASAWLEEPVQIASARAQIFPRPGVRLGEVRIGEPAAVTLQTVELSTALGALLNRRIEDAEVVIADSRIELPLPFDLPERAEAPADAEAAADGGIELVSVRAIALRDVVLASRGHEVTVSADSAFMGDRLDLQRFTAESGTTALEARGTVAIEPRLDADLQIEAGRVNLDELMAVAAAFTPPESAGGRSGSSAVPGRIAAHVTAESATTGPLEVREFATDMVLEGDRVTLSPLTFALFGGRYDGSLTATLGQAIRATLKSAIDGLDVAELAAFGGVPDTITGTLSGEGTFTGSGSDFAGVLQNARGTGAAAIADGTVRHLDLVRTVVLFFGRPAPETAQASDQFERMEMRFSLANQVFTADAFAFRSRDVDMDGTGTLTVPTKVLDGELSLRLSEELSAQAGRDLVRYTQENGRVVLPARIGGTLEQPKITIDAGAAAERGLRREVERRLDGLFDRFLPGRPQEPEGEPAPENDPPR